MNTLENNGQPQMPSIKMGGLEEKALLQRWLSELFEIETKMIRHDQGISILDINALEHVYESFWEVSSKISHLVKRDEMKYNQEMQRQYNEMLKMQESDQEEEKEEEKEEAEA